MKLTIDTLSVMVAGETNLLSDNELSEIYDESQELFCDIEEYLTRLKMDGSDKYPAISEALREDKIEIETE